MSREWKPGDVALVTFDDGTEHRAMRDCDGKGWGVVGKRGSLRVASARPLVVIDPDSPEDQRRLLDRLRVSGAFRGEVSRDVALDCIGDALRSLITPAKPNEPTGLGAVVEDDRGVLWTRVESGGGVTRNPWYPANLADLQPAEYAGVAVVKVLSEGISHD